MTTEDNRTCRIVGSIEFESSPAIQPALDQLPAPATQVLSIAGTLLSAHYGYPLAGLKVSAYFVEPIDPVYTGEASVYARADTPDTLLGDAASDSNGHFQILSQDTARVRQKLCLLTQCADSTLVLKVKGANGRFYYASDPIVASGGAVAVTLLVTLPEAEVTADTWAMLGRRLEEARITQVHDLARALVSSDETPLFSDHNLETRQAILNQLERAFLDPTALLREIAAPFPTWSDLREPGALDTLKERLQPHLRNPELKKAFVELAGKAESFSDLFSVDWTMDLNDLREGNVGLAVNKFVEHYRPGLGDVNGLFARFEENDLTRYRDYLRAIWTTWITKVVYIRHQLTEQQAAQQLQRRFHQNFFTLDSSPQPANKVLIPILLEILTAPTGNGWGFGLAPAAIDPQGTPREYLDYLIGLAELSARELGLRYRLDLQRPDSAISSHVQENIATLQGFYRDSFQCDLEPTHTDPDVLNQPIVPDNLQGKAPFFLHYDEWLCQRSPFYAENFFDIRRVYRHKEGYGISKKDRDNLASHVQNAQPDSNRPSWRFIADVLVVYDALVEGHRHFYRGLYGLAQQSYNKAFGAASVAMGDIPTSINFASVLSKRKILSVKNFKDLDDFHFPKEHLFNAFPPESSESIRDEAAIWLHFYALYVLPICLGDVALALGDYEKAMFYYGQTTRFAVGTAKESDSGGYRPHYLYNFPLYHIGDRPYTVNLHKGDSSEYPHSGDSGEYYDTTSSSQIEHVAEDLIKKYVHPLEAKYFRLRQANAMLEWADALYRTDDATNIQRARELYKGVLWLHGETPPICPTWPSDSDFYIPIFLNQRENPALTSQKVCARLGFYKIEAGLNYYGERNDIVPVLRYRPLSETADRFAALAKAAQQDFLLYMEKVESALIERMKLSNLLQKASLQATVAQEQIKIAEYNVTVAQEQVANVEAQITAKEQGIQDADSIFSQYQDFIGGIKKTFESLPGDTQSAVIAGFKSEVTGKALVGEGMLGLGAGASILTGFAIFGVAGYMSLSSMADAANRRSGELRTLRDKALPMAKGLVEAKKREVTIANYQKEIAQADIDLARDLITFEDNRFLNLNFWANLAQVLKRILRRYLELGARIAWLAERALAYEQDRNINIIRFDYFPEKFQGVTGANLLEADLAELEATRIEGIKRNVPVKYTLSLVRDFPLQFGQLKQTGRCMFKTEELPFALAYPGTMSYRIRAVSVMVSQTNLTNPLRGLLVNQGVSISHPGQPDEHVLVRPAEALPISEFKLQNDMAVYSLPDETLLTFEGSGIETFWELNFPAAANTFGFDGIADVLLTLDLWAQYSPDLYTKQLANMPTSVRRWIVVSGKQYQPETIEDLAGVATSVTLRFDLGALKLPTRETNRKLKNVALFFVSPSQLDAKAEFNATQPATSVNISFKQSIAMSNLPPRVSDPVPPPLPLNALADMVADQLFKLFIDKSENPGVDFSGVRDVVLAVEYAADLS